MAESCPDSERAGQVIAFLTRLRYLSLKEKVLLLKNCPYKGLVKRILGLAFAGNIFRIDLETINRKKTTDLVGADERLARFVVLNERFFAEEITVPAFLKKLQKLMAVLHVREFDFYSDLLSGGTCYLDFLSYRKIILKGKDETGYVRFMRPCEANSDAAWGGKRFVVQPNYQGIQLRIILEKGKKPKLIGRDQNSYSNRMKSTLKTAHGFLKESGLNRVEFDGILTLKDKSNRPAHDWKASECCLYIYDMVDESLPLKRRLRTVKAFCNFLKLAKNKRIIMMPTDILSGPSILAEAKRFSRGVNPYAARNGIIVKRWDSAYEFKRSPNWLTLTAFNDTESGTFLGRATIVGFAPGMTKIFAIDNNGLELEVEGAQATIAPLSKYVGFTVEYAFIRGYLSFRRVLYDKGREV